MRYSCRDGERRPAALHDGAVTGKKGEALVECCLEVPLQSGRARDRSSVTLLSAAHTSVLPGAAAGTGWEEDLSGLLHAAVIEHWKDGVY